MDPLRLCFACERERRRVIIERLTVAHHDERTVGTARTDREEVDPLLERRRERAAGLPDDRRIEVLKEEFERAIVAREWREDVAASRERDERDAITGRARAESAHFLLHALQTVRPFILGEHRERDIERERDIDPLRVDDRTALTPARRGESREQ